jgi:hypothetical protein
MIELLPIFLGGVMWFDASAPRFWRYPPTANDTWAWRTVQLCGSGTYAELAVRTYRLGDSLRQLCGGSCDCFWRRPFLALKQSEVTQEFITQKGSIKRIH